MVNHSICGAHRFGERKLKILLPLPLLGAASDAEAASDACVCETN